MPRYPIYQQTQKKICIKIKQIMEYVFCMPYGKEDVNIIAFSIIMMINVNDVADILEIPFIHFFFFC